jgi:hypothetical protein
MLPRLRFSPRNEVLCGLLLAFGLHAAQTQAQTVASCKVAMAVEIAPFKEAAFQVFREHHYAAAYGRFVR